MFEKVLLKTDRYSSMIYILMLFAGHRRYYVCSDKNLLIVSETFEIRIELDLLTHDDMIVVICHVYTTCN